VSGVVVTVNLDDFKGVGRKVGSSSSGVLSSELLEEEGETGRRPPFVLAAVIRAPVLASTQGLFFPHGGDGEARRRGRTPPAPPTKTGTRGFLLGGGGEECLLEG